MFVVISWSMAVRSLQKVKEKIKPVSAKRSFFCKIANVIPRQCVNSYWKNLKKYWGIHCQCNISDIGAENWMKLLSLREPNVKVNLLWRHQRCRSIFTCSSASQEYLNEGRFHVCEWKIHWANGTMYQWVKEVQNCTNKGPSFYW